MALLDIKNYLSGRAGNTSQSLVSSVNVACLELDNQFTIKGDRDNVARGLLGESYLIGKSLFDVLKVHTQPAQHRRMMPVFQSLMANQDIITSSREGNPFDCLRVAVASTGPKPINRFLRFEFLKDESFYRHGRWTVLIRDISKSVRLSRKIRKKTESAELKVNTIMSLLQFEHDLIKDFLDSTASSLRSVLVNLSAPENAVALTQTELRRRLESIFCVVHQIKGDAAILNLNRISQEAHDFENKLSLLNERRMVQARDLLYLAKPLKRCIAAVKEVKELYVSIREGGWGQQAKEQGPADNTLASCIEQLIEKIAAENGKRIILVNDGYKDSAVPSHLQRTLTQITTQLARNSVIHGIETPAERLKNQKMPYGCFHLSLERNSKGILLRVRDDGRGFDIDRIRRVAVAKKWVEYNELVKWSKRDLLNLTFLPGFSTQDKVSQHAGRGVGLDVIKRLVDQHGGRVAINSVFHQFTEFSFQFPLPTR